MGGLLQDGWMGNFYLVPGWNVKTHWDILTLLSRIIE